jgi:hypothetical protein
MGTTRRLWSTEPIWVWRVVVVAWWIFVGMWVLQAFSVGLQIVHALLAGG